MKKNKTETEKMQDLLDMIENDRIPRPDKSKGFGEAFTSHEAAAAEGKLTHLLGLENRGEDASLLTTVQPDRDDPESLEAVYVLGNLAMTFTEPTDETELNEYLKKH